MTMSPLQRWRLTHRSVLPPLLREAYSIACVQEEEKGDEEINPEIRTLFPHLSTHMPLQFVRGEDTKEKINPLKVGVLFSGGQAPGGHNVIVGIGEMLEHLHADSRLIGFLGGADGVLKNRSRSLTATDWSSYRNQGGFDLLGSGRTKIETPQQFEAVAHTLAAHELDGLVIIGGDDSNTNAAFLAEYCAAHGIPTSIVGVPKTIDGDLRNQDIELSFGFDTASKVYAESIGNLLVDARSAGKYYFFVKVMGRSASHLALECALLTHATYTLIGEEVACKQYTLSDIISQLADLICERARLGKLFGVIVIPEGLIEFIPECQKLIQELNALIGKASSPIDKNTLTSHLTPQSWQCFQLLPSPIQQQLLLERDAHGNVQLSKIETERLLLELTEQELAKRQIDGKESIRFQGQPLFYGYEGRSALPTYFDAQYAEVLGRVAALLVNKGVSGYMASVRHLSRPVEEWQLRGVPLVKMLRFEDRGRGKRAVIRKALVDLSSPSFQLFSSQRHEWRLSDEGSVPGPIQFAGPDAIIRRLPSALL